ncbi:AbgT family transporter [Vibrio lentus]|nr:AbgT family transporter [Vibrio lentus]
MILLTLLAPNQTSHFMFVSTFFISIAGALVTEKIVEPKLWGKYNDEDASEDLFKCDLNG